MPEFWARRQFRDLDCLRCNFLSRVDGAATDERKLNWPVRIQLVFTPREVDLAQSTLAGHLDAETYVLGAFNPGLTRLDSGSLLMMVRVAEALRHTISGNHVRASAGRTAMMS